MKLNKPTFTTLWNPLTILHLPHGKNRWCGPGAISIITGLDTDSVSRLVRSFTGNTKCTGMTNTSLRRALRMCNIRLKPILSNVDVNGHLISDFKSPTITKWRKDNADKLKITETGYNVYLVNAGHHYQILQGEFFIDNQVQDFVLFDDLKKGKRRKIRKIWQVLIHKNGIVIPPEAQKPKPNPKRRLINKLLKKAKQLNVDVDVDYWDKNEQDISVWMYVSDEHEQIYGDPWIDQHCFTSYADCIAALAEEESRRIDLKID